ncbi:MAG: hypothetical protein K2X10_10280 [Hyphomicrobiales bacterium]|nr:hypothetical protein [Hyphomicrobiales bacterium]
MVGGGDVRTIEVLRSGTFTPMSGAPVTFAAADLQAIADAYDGAAAPAPAVIGHPKTDAPAWAWAKSFRYDAASDRLLAELGDIHPALAEAVADKRYKKISLSLFTPDAANNPKPGEWYPKHVGFLGAAAPAVSGLQPVAFEANPDGIVTFEFADASALRDVAGLFRSMREWMIEKFGSDVADKALPGWTIGWVDEAADRDPPEPYTGFSAPPIKEKTMNNSGAAQAAELAERERALDERERAANHAANVAFCERLAGEGRLLPALTAKVTALLDSLAPVAGSQVEVSFADDAITKTSTALELVKDILSAQPAVVSFGAVDLGKETSEVADFAMPPGATADASSAELHARGLAYQRAHPGVDYMAAIAAVNR